MAVWTSTSQKNLGIEQRWDAEFFQPKFQSLDKALAKLGSVPLAEFAVSAERGSAPAYSEDGEIPVIRSVNVRDLEFSTTRQACVSREFFNANPASQIRKNDLAVTSTGVGTLGRVFSNVNGGNYLADGHVTIVRLKQQADAAVLSAILQSCVGGLQFERWHRGSSGQIEIYPADILSVRIPKLPSQTEGTVVKLWREAVDALSLSQHLIPDAENELLDRLGWAELAERPHELTYNANFSTLAATGRSDAEFFQPHCLRLRERLSEAGGKMLGEFCPEPSRGVQPEFAESGTVLALDSKSIRPHGAEPSGERVTQAFYDSGFATKARVHKNDVLLNSTGRGTLGRAACYQLNAAAVCDNHVAILRPDPNVCHPHYLALFLNSPAGLTQSEQYQTGSSGQLEIYPQHIQQFLVFVPRTKSGAIDMAWQAKLGAKVEAATHAREEAQGKLNAAKRLVEEVLSAK